MADNYLENRMEAYRSGRLARTQRTSASMRGVRRGNTLEIDYPPMAVLVDAPLEGPLMQLVLGRLVSLGLHVAFTTHGNDTGGGQRMAQSTGARYYPGSLGYDGITAHIHATWGTLPLTVVTASALSLPGADSMLDINGIVSAAPTNQAAADAIALALHPRWRWVAGIMTAAVSL